MTKRNKRSAFVGVVLEENLAGFMVWRYQGDELISRRLFADKDNAMDWADEWSENVTTEFNFKREEA